MLVCVHAGPSKYCRRRSYNNRHGSRPQLMALTFPVPEGLLDLLRDFTVAVVRNDPDDLERFAAEYFTELAAAMDRDETGSVECSKTRSFLEFDEAMYATYAGSDQGLDAELGSSQKGSQRSVAESQRSHASAALEGEDQKEKCPDEAAICWEKMMETEKVAARDCAAEEEARVSAMVGSASNVDRASVGVRDSSVRDSNVRDSTVRDSAVGQNAAEEEPRDSAMGSASKMDRASVGVRDSSVRDSNVRDSTVRDSAVGQNAADPEESAVRESTVAPNADDVASVASGASAK